MRWFFARRRPPRGRSLGAARAWAAALVLVSAACGGDSSGPPRVATVTITPNPANVAIGGTLQLTAVPKDAGGATIPGVSPTWRSAAANIAGVSSSGLVTGNLAGTTQVTASFNGAEGTVTVTVAPPPVASVTIEPSAPNTTVGGTIQLQAITRDANNNVLTGRQVSWASLAQGVVTVDNNGLARGVTAGTAQVTATSEGVVATVTVSVLTALSITSITPSPLVPGGTATITGAGFSATPLGNTVTVGGIAASVTAATVTSLSVTLPASMCLPSGTAVVSVTVAGGGDGQLNHPFQSNDAPFTLAVGQQSVVIPPANFCLQFGGGAAAEQYVIGVQSVSDVPSSLTPAVLRAAIPASASPAEPIVTSAARAVQPSTAGSLNTTRLQRRERHRQAEMSIRAQERALGFNPRAATAEAQLSVASTTVPGTTNVGDTLTIRVPNRATICQNPTSIRAVVRHKGARAFFLEDVGNPAGGFTAADYQSLGSLMDNQIWTTDNAYFGTPTDRDANSRIVIVITKEINRVSNILGFVSSGDFQPAVCPASNNGEYYYGFAPDPTGQYALGVFSLDDARYEWPLLIAHEFTHIIQFGRRIETPNATAFQSPWELEGQATLAEEVVGHAVLGRQTRQNYGIEVVLDTDSTQASDWYFAPFLDLFLYYGYSGATTKIPTAPEECGWLTTTAADLGPCLGARGAYGVSWSFLRWISDQFGPTFSGGEQGIHRALIGGTLSGFANIFNTVGEPVDRMLPQWAAALYVDDGIPGLNTRLTFASWNMLDINFRVLPITARLTPRARTFSNFSDQVTVRAGSSAYFRVGGTNRPATAISVANPTGGALPVTMRLWVVRIQ